MENIIYLKSSDVRLRLEQVQPGRVLQEPSLKFVDLRLGVALRVTIVGFASIDPCL